MSWYERKTSPWLKSRLGSSKRIGFESGTTEGRVLSMPSKLSDSSGDFRGQPLGCRSWQRYKLGVNLAVRADGMHGESQFAAPGEPACGRRHMPGNSLSFEHSPIVPMPHQHMLDTELPQDLHLLRTIWLTNNPACLRIRKSSVVEDRDILHSDNDPPLAALVPLFFPVFTSKPRQPDQHALSLLLSLVPK